MRRKGTLGIEPVEFKGLGNLGKPGDLGDTSYFLNSKLRQNIAYAAYFEPKTKLEIAEELGLLDKVMTEGWRSLSSKETGRIGGLLAKRKRK